MTTVGATLLLAAASGHAQFADKLYFDVDGGGAFQQDIAIKNGTGFGNPPGNVKFDTGWRAGADVGYNFCKYFAAEVESGVIWNDINMGSSPALSAIPSAKAHLEEVPLLVNGIYKFPLEGSFKPYVGVGVGGVFGIFDSSNIPGSGPGAAPTYRDTDCVFAYQAEAGFKYSVSTHMDLGVAYKFVGTTDHNWHDNNITLKTDGTMTHTILATFTWRF